MEDSLFWLRLAFRTGAVLDGLMVIPMLCPQIAGALLGIPGFNPGSEYRYAMGIGASLMLGWTTLLVWADRKPLERRDVLLFTAFPVVVGLIMSEVYAVNASFVAALRMLPVWTTQGVLLALFGYAYVRSHAKARKPSRHEVREEAGRAGSEAL